ncbi:MAG: response regulator [Candidatus Moranbacteria bacterium]|nr:response regulator [Candidatus Moranbacteria bacterium]
MKFLVVEDTSYVGEALCEMLRVLSEKMQLGGAIIDWARTIPEAEAFFGQKQYDLVLSDFDLKHPEKNGLELAKIARERGWARKIIIMSGLVKNLVACEEAGFQILPKPSTVQQLMQAIRN